MKDVFKRTLGRSGIEVSALGLGCWAIGGPFILDGKPDGWGDIDDNESIKAIHAALDHGINYFDTADAYGVGHSEEVLGKALSGKRDKAVISTKFGYFGNEATKTLYGVNLDPGYIKRACEASLKRLNTDYIDVYLLHAWDILVSDTVPVLMTLEELVEQGKIRTYGWSTDLVNGIRIFSEMSNFSVVENCLNVFQDAPEMIELCEKNNLASVNRSPLAMGFLSGKFDASTQLSKDDVRGAGHSWIAFFKDGKPLPEFLKALDSVKEILTSNGRTLVQGALAWIWGRSGNTIPIPGFKSVKQVEENARAMEFGPLTQDQMDEIERILRQER